MRDVHGLFGKTQQLDYDTIDHTTQDFITILNGYTDILGYRLDPWVAQFPVKIFVEQKWLLGHMRLATAIWEQALGFETGTLFVFTHDQKTATLIVHAGTTYIYKNEIYVLRKNKHGVANLGNAYSQHYARYANIILVKDTGGGYYNFSSANYVYTLVHELGHTPFGLCNTSIDTSSIMYTPRPPERRIANISQSDIALVLQRLKILQDMGIKVPLALRRSENN